MARAAHLLISGRVQGVGFRYATYHQARQQGVHGWVRNRTDGRVEAQLHGNPEAIHHLITWCRKGPPGAFVERVEVAWEEAVEEPMTFEIEELA